MDKEKQMAPVDKLKEILDRDNVKEKFHAMLGKKAAGFTTSIISAVNRNPSLKTADPGSVISAAAIAASLDLPINQNLGFAHIVPYKNKAQFQMGWKGFVQLAMRSGQYKTMNVSEVYEGEIVSNNHITGEMEFDIEERKSDKIIGYVAYFKLLNGFEKYLYMTKGEVEAHGEKYSASYYSKRGQWQKGFDYMAKKTVLKMLLSKYGILSIDMGKAIEYDQAEVSENGPEYLDNPDMIETSSEPVDPESIRKEIDGEETIEGEVEPDEETEERKQIYDKMKKVLKDTLGYDKDKIKSYISKQDIRPIEDVKSSLKDMQDIAKQEKEDKKEKTSTKKKGDKK